MSFGKFISPRLFFYRDTKNRIWGKFALIWKHHFIKANFCYALTALFFRRRRKTNAATEKRFSQFHFLTIFTAPFLQAISKDKRSKRKTFLSIFFLFIFTALSLHALSKDKRGNRKMFLSIFLLVHLHHPVFTGGIVKDIMQLIVKIEFFYLYIKNKPRRLSGLCDSLADFPL